MNKFRLAIITALCLGLATAFAFAPYHIYPLAVLTPAGLLALIQSRSAREAKWLGFCYGLGCFGAGVSWVYISIHTYGGAPVALAALITAAMVSFLSLYPMLACYLTNRYFDQAGDAKNIFAFPAIWVGCEFLRSFMFSGFPWLLVGYSQTASPLKGYAPIVGIYGVSLMVVMSSGLLVCAHQAYKKHAYRTLYFRMLAVATIWMAGAMLSLIPWTNPEGQPLNVSLVQGDIPQSLKWNPDHIQLSFDRYRDLTKPLWGKADIIVWPEAAIPMTLQSAAKFIEDMDERATQSGSNLVLGIPVENDHGGGYYNTIVTLGATKQIYQKRHLVPFGEYVPFQHVASRIFDFMHVPLPDMREGMPRQNPIYLHGIKVTPSICFEIAYAELNNMRDPSVGMLLTVTNDAWFGHSAAQAQHLQIAMMRALELRRPVIFASNNGISAIIDANGQVMNAAPTHVATVLTSTIQPMTGYTPWIMNGLDPFLFIILCLLIVARRAAKANLSATEATPTIQNEISHGRTI